MTPETDRVRADFDRIARVTHPDEPPLYCRALLAELPPRVERALEVGCGAGEFTRRLATRARQVTAIDLSPGMLAVAAAHSRAHPNIEYQLADAAEVALPARAFDAVVSIATLHHLPFEATLARLAAAVAPGGVLIVHDLFADHTLIDRALSVVAFAASLPRRLRPSVRASPEARAAWAAHAALDQLLALAEVRRRAAVVLPGARVRRHLRWRYSLVWRPG